jgi:hypothetical protein
MIPLAFRKFLSQLQLATEEGRISWNEADAHAYFCDHKDYTVHVSAHIDSDRDISVFRFRFRSKNGKLSPFIVREDEDRDYEVMLRLYEAVVANANKVGDDFVKFFT